MEWISVKDRLPEPEKGSIYSRGVLATDEDDLVIFYATYVKRRKCWLDYHLAPNGNIDPISHWMEIPEFSV
jgi:hypothetical protein